MSQMYREKIETIFLKHILLDQKKRFFRIMCTLFQRVHKFYFPYQESELKDLADQMELRAKELKSQEAMLQTKVS